LNGTDLKYSLVLLNFKTLAKNGRGNLRKKFTLSKLINIEQNDNRFCNVRKNVTPKS